MKYIANVLSKLKVDPRKCQEGTERNTGTATTYILS